MRIESGYASKAARLLSCAGACVLAASLAACGEPLLSEDESRSQYDRNDTARDRRAPAYVWDHHGDRKPNIRGRVLLGAE